MLHCIPVAQQKHWPIQRIKQLLEPGWPGWQEDHVILMRRMWPQLGQSLPRARWLVCARMLKSCSVVQDSTTQSQLPGKGWVTSVDVCEGSFHIYGTVGKLGTSERLLKLDHAVYGMLTAQGSAGPVFTLGSSSCLQQGIGISLKPSHQVFKNSPHMSNRGSRIKIHYL